MFIHFTFPIAENQDSVLYIHLIIKVLNRASRHFSLYPGQQKCGIWLRLQVIEIGKPPYRVVCNRPCNTWSCPRCRPKKQREVREGILDGLLIPEHYYYFYTITPDKTLFSGSDDCLSALHEMIGKLGRTTLFRSLSWLCIYEWKGQRFNSGEPAPHVHGIIRSDSPVSVEYYQNRVSRYQLGAPYCQDLTEIGHDKEGKGQLARYLTSNIGLCAPPWFRGPHWHWYRGSKLDRAFILKPSEEIQEFQPQPEYIPEGRSRSADKLIQGLNNEGFKGEWRGNRYVCDCDPQDDWYSPY